MSDVYDEIITLVGQLRDEAEHQVEPIAEAPAGHGGGTLSERGLVDGRDSRYVDGRLVADPVRSRLK